MPTPRILVLRAPGTNCDRETAYAFERAGGQADLVHINRLLENPSLLAEYQVLCLPGGFSYGDDIAVGRILANQIRHHLSETLQAFKAAEKLILGICNGFQVLLKSGVLLPDDPARPADGSSGPAGLIPPPGWEPDETVIARAWQSLEELARRIREAEASAALAVTHSGLIYAVERDLGAARARIANLEGRWVHRGPTGWSLGDRHLLVDPTRADVTRPDAL